MVASLSKVAFIGMVFVVALGFAKGHQETQVEMETVTMQEIDAMMEMEEFEEEGTRDIQEDDTCWHGGRENQNLSWLGRSWGNCQNLDPCVCGMHPRRMAYWCPYLCRPSCGGACATPSSCPQGFNIENGQVVAYSGTPDPTSYPSFWPANWGTQCQWYDNPAAPGATPAPTPPGDETDGECGQVNTVCTSMSQCCSYLSCGPTLSDGNQYCAPGADAPAATPAAPMPSPTTNNGAPMPSPTTNNDGAPTLSPTTNNDGAPMLSPSINNDGAPMLSPSTNNDGAPMLSPTTNNDGAPMLSPTTNNDGAPMPSPTTNNDGDEQCSTLNTVCDDDTACCAGLSCGPMRRDGNRYCVLDCVHDSATITSRAVTISPVSGLPLVLLIAGLLFLSACSI